MNTDVDGEWVTRESDIQRLLRSLRDGLIPVTLLFPATQKSLTTYVVDVVPSAGSLLFDEPLPRDMAAVLTGGEPFLMQSNLDGVFIQSTPMRIPPSARSSTETGLSCPLPEAIYTHQRRKSFRAMVRRSLVIRVEATDGDGRARVGLLRDCSADGCRLEFTGDRRSDYAELGEPLALTLTFPDRSTLSCEASLQRLSYEGDTDLTTLGCRFAAMPAQTHTDIAALVTDLQRDHINFLKKGGTLDDIPARFLNPAGEAPVDPGVATDARPGPRAPSATRPTQSKAGKSRRDPVTVDVETLWRNALAAVRKQRQYSKAEPLPELTDALDRLADGWRDARQALMVLSRIRSPDNTEVERHLAINLVLADHGAQVDDHRPEVFRQVMERGLLKRLDAARQPMAALIAALDTLAFRPLEGQWVYHPTAAFGVLHKKGKTEAALVRRLIATQGLYPLGGAVRLSNDCVGLVLRQTNRRQPAWVRQVYRLSEASPLPPRDLNLADNDLTVEGPADPVKAGLNVELLRPPLRA